MDKIEDKEMQNIVEGIIEKCLTAMDRTNTILSVGRRYISRKSTGAYCALICVSEIEYTADG